MKGRLKKGTYLMFEFYLVPSKESDNSYIVLSISDLSLCMEKFIYTT